MRHPTKRPLRWPSLKRFLIRVNNDIDLLSEAITISCYDEFTDFHKMVIVLEDRRYFFHLGVDYISFIRDIWRLFTFRSHGGFSTIEMQFVRTVTNKYDRTLRRKLYEILLAYLCNWHFKKFELLNSYLCIAYFGSNYQVSQSYGCYCNYERVANDLFGKAPYELELSEAAEIAAYLVYPRPSKPSPEWRKKIERRKRYALSLFPRYKDIFDKISIR